MCEHKITEYNLEILHNIYALWAFFLESENTLVDFAITASKCIQRWPPAFLAL